MKYGIQKEIAAKARTTTSHLSMILSGARRPSWELAVRLGEATQTDPKTWMEGYPDDIKDAINASSAILAK